MWREKLGSYFNSVAKRGLPVKEVEMQQKPLRDLWRKQKGQDLDDWLALCVTEKEGLGDDLVSRRMEVHFMDIGSKGRGAGFEGEIMILALDIIKLEVVMILGGDSK